MASATELPLCIYNNPGTTHFSFSDDLIARLSMHPQIRAVKNPAAPVAEAPERHQALRKGLPGDFALGYSGDWNAAQAVMAGGLGWYSVIGGLMPEPTLKLMRAAQAGDAAEVERISAVFEPLWALFRELTSYRVVYAAANAMGLTTAQPPRPILPLSPADQARVMEAIEGLAAA